MKGLPIICLVVLSATSLWAQSGTAKPYENQGSDQVSNDSKRVEAEINAIGTRNVGGRRWGDWYSLKEEVQMGQEYSRLFEAEVKLLADPVVNEYVNRLGQNLVRNSDAQVPFTIKVVDSDTINAFSLPGGFLYVNSGLIVAASDEAELAGVMAHEIAHVAARHATRQLTRSSMITLLSLPLIFVGGAAGYAVLEVSGIGVPVTMLKFSRSFESEADYLGVEYMYKAGYDPQAFVSFFEKVRKCGKEHPGLLERTFASHPPTVDRIKKTQREIASIPDRDEYVVTTSDFIEIKARLAAAHPSRSRDALTLLRLPVPDTQQNTRPEDEHPTLKRRDD